MLWGGRGGSSERFCLHKRRSPGFASPPAALGKDTAFSCWRLNQYLLWELPSSCMCTAGHGGPGDPDSTGAHGPAEQGGSAAPMALDTPAMPQITPPFWRGTATTKIRPSEETQHCSREEREAGLTPSALSWVGEQTNQAGGPAETAFASWPGSRTGKTPSFTSSRGSAGSIHQLCPSSSRSHSDPVPLSRQAPVLGERGFGDTDPRGP